MHILRSWLRYFPGLLCLIIGLVQLVWVWWLVGNSLHMGSPLRRQGDTIIHLIDDPAVQISMESLHKVGLLGFDLLGYSMWLHLVCGVALAGLGVALVISALYKHAKVDH